MIDVGRYATHAKCQCGKWQPARAIMRAETTGARMTFYCAACNVHPARRIR